jgi:hypothetical protein
LNNPKFRFGNLGLIFLVANIPPLYYNAFDYRTLLN